MTNLTTSYHGVNPLEGNSFSSKADAQEAVRALFEPLLPYYEASPSRPMVGQTAPTYDEASESVETFIRPIWALAPLAAGGGSFDHWDIIREGLIRGTDPNSDGYWGPVGATPDLNPVTDQRMVEMAAFGLALAIAPDEFFEPLTDQQKQNVVDWLQPINEIGLRDNNWQFFRVLVNLGFQRVGVDVATEAVEESLGTLESNYLGDGWYQDGETQKTTDFYIPFAFHYYSLIYARLAAETDPERSETFKKRAAEFAPDFAARFDSEGRTIAYGRSMTYRFAAAGFFGALAFGDVEPENVSWGEIRGHWARHLRWWSKQAIADNRGILTIGWGYNNMYMAESYNAPGSPYWAMKAFLPLALPDDHPFWTAEEKQPAEQDLHSIQPNAHAVVNRTADQSQMLTTSGDGLFFPRQGAAKYGKFVYSSQFPFGLESDDPFNLTAAESTLAIVDVNGGPAEWRRENRWKNERQGMKGDVLWAEWKAFNGDVTVTSVWAGEGDEHSRIHLVDTKRSVTAVDGGFAIAYNFDPTHNDYRTESDETKAMVANGVDYSVAATDSAAGKPVVRQMQPNGSIMWARSVSPVVDYELEPGRHVLRSYFRAGSGDPQELSGFDEKLVDVLAEVSGVDAADLKK